MTAPASVVPGPTLEAARARTRTLMRTRHHADLRRGLVVLVALVLLAVTGLLVETLTGRSGGLSVREALPALVGGGDALAHYVVFETRLPRALGALLGGLIFGLSGHLYQTVIRNPLATPDIIGITSGATAGAVAAIILTPGAGLGIQASGLIGAAIALAIVFGLAWRGGVNTYRLVLVGIGVSALGAAVTSWLITLSDRLGAMNNLLRWTVGSASFVQWPDVTMLAAVAGLSALGVAALARGLAALRLGDDLSTALGTRTGLVRVGALVLGAVATALTTSVMGPIGFVALVAGPITRLLVPRGPHLLLAPVAGAVITVGSDIVAQSAPFGTPLPTGAVVGLIGAPMFILLLFRGKGGTS